ncbi:MAG: hypothetical protein CMI09_03095 [Oceanospirillaceae bacterium]|nr:hypothetical protein [Oceanospirillaceae bacterium]
MFTVARYRGNPSSHLTLASATAASNTNIPVRRSLRRGIRLAGLMVLAGSSSIHADGLTNRPLLMPGTIHLDGNLRGRIESLDDQYRAAGHGTDQILATRTDFTFSIPFTRFQNSSNFVLELTDSRHFSSDDDTTLTTATVNTLEAVQARVSVRSDLLPWQISDHEINFGRQTLDIGSRRLMARNRYRNTFNTFDGLHLVSNLRYSKARVEGLVFYPVSRYPDTRVDLENNQHEADKSSLHVQLLGLSADGYVLKGRIRGSAQWFKLREADTSRLETRNRNITTLAGRLYLTSQPGQVDFDLELARQSGTSRLTADEADRTDLDHDAWFYHLELGYQFRTRWQWQLKLQYDHASGDLKPDDERNNRFDTLYGARRFDFGPTGIFGSFARSNIASPAVRAVFKPSPSSEIMLAWRWYQLASDRDAWVGSGYRDASGESGDFVGQQPEFRWRWKATRSVDVETGAAWLKLGTYASKAASKAELAGGTPRAEPVPESALYSYLQATWKF